MFQLLTQNLTKVFDKLKGRGLLTAEHIDSAMRDIRVALLEADVALPVVKDFIAKVREKAIGQEIVKSVQPAQMVVKILHDELVSILYASKEELQLQLRSQPPVNILMVGLQGSGKTTATGKLALKLKNSNKKVLLVSLDVYRPAAREQLAKLAGSIAVDCFVSSSDDVMDIAQSAIREAKLLAYDVVIYDTAGRLHIDDNMIDEAVSLKKLINPAETLLVVDAMTGQDAVNLAKNFDEKLNITGTVLSRVDGDSRGGAALSVKYITGKPIKFLSSGEKLSSLEEFDPVRLASRILDMGDIVSFVETAASMIDRAEAQKAAAKMQKGKFDLDDYLLQLRSIRKLGGIKGIVGMLPGAGRLMEQVNASKLNEKLLVHQEAIILSMTKREKRNPDVLNASRRRRIAIGSGTSVQQVNTVIKQFQQLQDLIKRASKMDKKNFMRSAMSKLF